MKPGRISLRGDAFVIETLPHVSIKLRRLFRGVQRLAAGVFELAATAEHAYDLEWFRDRYPLEVDSSAEDKFRYLVARHENKLASIAEIDSDSYTPPEFDLAIPPREYQRLAADLGLKTGSLLIADEIGTGKTISAISLLAGQGTLPAVIVTMTHLGIQWGREIGRFAPKLRAHRIRKTQPYDLKTVKFETDFSSRKRRKVDYSNPPDVLITTYSKLGGWVETFAGRVNTIVFDEVQDLRHAGTLKYDAAKAIAETCQFRVGLSATPIYGYGEEIFNVMNVLAPGQLGTREEFLTEWCSGSGYDQDKSKVRDPAALGTYLREAGLMIRRTRKEVGRELPELTIVRHAVEADPESIKKASADVAELAQRVLDRIGTPLERMQTAGELDYRLRLATGIAKAGAMADFVRLLVESDERVVLFAWHHEVYDLVCSSFDKHGVTWARYTGKESASQKDEARRKFLESEAKVLIISLRSGAGLDGLQKVCRTVVIGELDWSPQVIHQCIGRAHRDGQEHPVMAYVLEADEGSDPVILDVLGIKDAQSLGILDPEASASTEPVLAGASDDHIRRLAEDVIRRRNKIKEE